MLKNKNLSSTIRLRFIEAKNAMVAEPSLDDLDLPEDLSDNLSRIFKIVESKSGIRKTSRLSIFFILAFFSVIGFGLGMYLVMDGNQLLAGITLISTPLLCFFVILGWLSYRGSQIERFERWWSLEPYARGKGSKKKVGLIVTGGDFILAMERMGFKCSYSFSVGKISKT